VVTHWSYGGTLRFCIWRFCVIHRGRHAVPAKRYGIWAAINQGRALARYEMGCLIEEIQTRVTHHDLNRGLNLSVPYFDDQTLTMCQVEFEVIPSGRIMFVPAFVVKSSREEQAKVCDDTRVNASTRLHVLQQLKQLEHA
jgi:hypothetical protein